MELSNAELKVQIENTLTTIGNVSPLAEGLALLCMYPPALVCGSRRYLRWLHLKALPECDLVTLQLDLPSACFLFNTLGDRLLPRPLQDWIEQWFRAERPTQDILRAAVALCNGRDFFEASLAEEECIESNQAFHEILKLALVKVSIASLCAYLPTADAPSRNSSCELLRMHFKEAVFSAEDSSRVAQVLREALMQQGFSSARGTNAAIYLLGKLQQFSQTLLDDLELGSGPICAAALAALPRLVKQGVMPTSAFPRAIELCIEELKNPGPIDTWDLEDAKDHLAPARALFALLRQCETRYEYLKKAFDVVFPFLLEFDKDENLAWLHANLRNTLRAILKLR